MSWGDFHKGLRIKGTLVCTFDPSTPEAGAGRSLWIPDQYGSLQSELQVDQEYISETVSKKKKIKKQRRRKRIKEWTKPVLPSQLC